MTPLSILQIPAGSPLWVYALVESALILHIGGGSVAILSGAAALTVRKGERLHRAFGNAFFVAMLTMSAMGTALAVWLHQIGNMIGGPFAFYLVATAWATVRRKEGGVGAIEYSAFVLTASVAAVFLVCGVLATLSPSHGFQGYAPTFYYVAGSVVAFIAAIDLRTILRGGVSGVQRIARHVWRMCASLFIASGSFFIGQQKVLPVFMHGSPILFLLGLAPLLVMVFWLFRIRIENRFRSDAIAA
jgi:uncharacterized membrane protein